MKKAIIIDAYSQDNYHEVINQSYLMMLMDIYDEVEYIAEQRSCANIKRLLNLCKVEDSNVHFVPKHINKRDTTHNILYKMWWFLKVSILNYWYFMNTDKDADVFFNNNIHLGIPLINYLSFGKHNRVFDMCHAEMEMICKDKSDSLSRRIGSRLYRYAFCRMRLKPNLNFILLSSAMASDFKGMISPHNRPRIHGMDHPYIRPEIIDNATDGHNPALRIGIPGAITPQRGLPQIKELLLSFPDNGTRLYGISHCSENIDSPYFIPLNTSGRLTPYEEYGRNIASMDILLLLYKPGSYRFTASGAALEAIWQQKPIIALRNEYIEYLFRKFGPMGFICNDIHEMTSIISNLTREQLSAFSDNLTSARTALLPTNITSQLRNIIETA